MQYLGTIELFNGQAAGDVWTSSRNGSMSPVTVFIRYDNRWVTPYERKVRKWNNIDTAILLLVLQKIYGKPGSGIAELIANDNPLLSICKESSWSGSSVRIKT